MVSFRTRRLVLTLELLFLLDCVRVVLDQTASGRDVKLVDASIVQLVDRLIEGVSVDVMPLTLQLGIKLSELVLNRPSLDLQFLIVKLVLRSAVDAELKDLVGFLGSFPVHFEVALLG